MSFPNTSLADIHNRTIALDKIAVPFGPYINSVSVEDRKLVQQIQQAAENVISNSFINVLRSVSFIVYFLTSAQMTMNFLLIQAVFPSNFYEILRLLCAGYVSVIPSQSALED